MSADDDVQTMKERFAEDSDETLMTRLVEKADEFEPEALKLMEEELLRRGVSRSKIQWRRAEHHAPDHETGSMVAVADFESRYFAQQALDVLKQKDVEGLIVDPASLGPNEFPIPDIEGFHVLLVPEENAEKARLLLSAFPPAADDEGEPREPAEG